MIDPNYYISIIEIEKVLALYCVDLTWNDPLAMFYYAEMADDNHPGVIMMEPRDLAIMHRPLYGSHSLLDISSKMYQNNPGILLHSWNAG